MSGIKRIRCPVLIVHGTDDSVVPYQVRDGVGTELFFHDKISQQRIQCGLDLFEARSKVQLPQVRGRFSALQLAFFMPPASLPLLVFSRHFQPSDCLPVANVQYSWR
jgi:hypothetical protein